MGQSISALTSTTISISTFATVANISALTNTIVSISTFATVAIAFEHDAHAN